MKATTLFAPLLIATSALVAPAAAAPELFGGLAPGPHAVGFRQIERLDHSRLYYTPRTLDGQPRDREHARPIRISVWYPAQPGAGKPLTLGDYVALMGVEDRLGGVTPERAKIGEAAFFAFPLLTDLDADKRKRILGLSGIARRDARPARGKFPVVLYSLGSAAIGNVTPELLASNGYIVAQAPRLGVYAGLPPDGRDLLDLLSKVADLDQVVNALAAVPEADVTNMATIGFSAGGVWALYTTMKNAHVRAMVSLDTIMLFDDPFGRIWRQAPQFNPEAVRAPVMHLIRKEWVPRESAKQWEALAHSDRLNLRFDDPALDHMDFQSAGFAQTLVGGRPDKAKAVRAAFDLWNRYTLAFLDANLRDQERARGFLARTPEENGAAPGAVVLTRLPADPSVALTGAVFFNAIADGGAGDAVAAVRRLAKTAGKPPLPEADLVLAGYSLLLSGQQKQSLPLFELLVELYPRSANANDSLADAYLALGDRERARAFTDKAKTLLDADKDTPPERRANIQKSIDDKRAQLK
jgi:dienelactone hydrolase